MQWSDHNINFTLDGDLVGNIDAPEGGFWKLGGFDKTRGSLNIWESGNGMAPFDKEVSGRVQCTQEKHFGKYL